MRLHTPVPSISRAVEEEFVLDGVTIPVGVNVEINIHSLHNNEAVWGTDYNVNITRNYSRIHINRGEWISPISQSILNLLS